jgi:hypothetical protein
MYFVAVTRNNLPVTRRPLSNTWRGGSTLLFRVVTEGKRKEKKLAVKRYQGKDEYADMDTYIKQHRDVMSKQEVVAMFLESSKRKVRISRLKDLTTSFQNNFLEYDANALSVMVCGLQLYSSSDQPARHLLSAICDRLHQSGISDDSQQRITINPPPALAPPSPVLKWSPVECMNALYGLKGFTSQMPEIQRLFALLPRHTQPITSTTRVSAKMLAKGLYGLQHMSSDEASTRNILAFYHGYLLACHNGMDEQSLSHCLFGLQGCSSDHIEVQDVLVALLVLLNRDLTFKLQPRSVGAAVFGLQRMSNSHVMVDELVGTIVTMAQRGVVSVAGSRVGLPAKSGPGEGGYEAYTVGSIFLGLQQMEVSTPARRQLLAFLCEQLECCEPASFNELALVNMFYGLQNMSSDDQEVREVLRVLTEKLTQWTKLSPLSSSHQLSLRGVASCLFGMRQMSDSHTEVTRAVRVLREQLVLVPSRHKQDISLSMNTNKTKSIHGKAHHHQSGAPPPPVLNSKVISLASGVFRNMHSDDGEVRRMLKTQAAVWTALGGGKPAPPSRKKGTNNKHTHSSRSSQKQQNNSPSPSPSCSSSGFQWDSQAVGNVLYNLRNMSNEYEEVQSMLAVIWRQGLQEHATAIAASGHGKRKQGCMSFSPLT